MWLITEAPDGRCWGQELSPEVADLLARTSGGRLPIDHYSQRPELPYLFYKGVFSSFYELSFRVAMLDEPNLEIPVYPTYWKTREHWFQAHKPSEINLREAIARAIDPFDAKRMGGSHSLFRLRTDWDQGYSYAVMCAGLVVQLRQYRQLAEGLIETGDRLIAEDSPTDNIWGIRGATGMGFGGQNWLGAAWMAGRDVLMGRRAVSCAISTCDRKVAIDEDWEDGEVVCVMCTHGHERLV